MDIDNKIKELEALENKLWKQLTDFEKSEAWLRLDKEHKVLQAEWCKIHNTFEGLKAAKAVL